MEKALKGEKSLDPGSGPGWLRISEEFGHPFRRNSATCFDWNRPLFSPDRNRWPERTETQNPKNRWWAQRRWNNLAQTSTISPKCSERWMVEMPRKGLSMREVNGGHLSYYWHFLVFSQGVYSKSSPGHYGIEA